jgi:MFS family permease
LIAGRTVSSLGSSLTPVALAFAVLDLGGSATELGLVVAAYALVEVVTTVFAGVLGDRFSRAMLMQGTSALAAATQAVTAAALLGGWAGIPLLTVLGGMLGLLTALAGPSSRAIVPQTVDAEALPTAVAALRLSQNTAMVLGFGAAGLLVSVVGTGGAIAVDAVTFALAAACFAAVRVPALPAPDPQTLLGDLRAGAAEVFAHTWLWTLIGQALIYHLVYGGAQGVLGPIVVRRDHGEAAWGWALGALMLGFLLGGLVTLRYRPRRLLFSGTAFLALTACFPLVMGLQLPLTLVLAGAFLHGLGLEIFSVAWDLSIQQNVAPDKLARVFAFDQVGSFVVRPLGLALTGPVAEALGESRWLVVTAAVMVGSVLLSLLPRSVRHLERQAA